MHISKPIVLSILICFITVLVHSPLSAQYTSDQTPDQASFPWPEGIKAAISLTFDDARLSQVDTGIPLLNQYNVKATFYVSPDRMMERLDGWRAALASGHEIGNHSMIHPCTGNFPWARSKALENYTMTQMDEELKSANEEVFRQLNITPISFAYPCGQKFVGRGKNLKSYVPLIAHKFQTGRGWLDEGPNDPFTCDFAQLTGMPSDQLSFEEIKQIIDQAVENGSWLVLAGHETGDDEGFQTTRLSTLDAICKYASDPKNGIWIDNVANIANYVHKQRQKQKPPFKYFKNESEVDKKVDSLLNLMTLEEKIGQINMPCGYQVELGESINDKIEGSKKFTRGKLVDHVGPAGGFFTFANNNLQKGPKQQAVFFNELQKIALNETRLKIPLIEVEEGTHGLMAAGGTIFPEGLALGSTWDMEMIHNIYSVAAKEARSIGIHSLFTLVIEPVRDPRLGRNIEAYSEDPFLVSKIAEQIVIGVQGDDISAGDKVIAGLCHYPGQSEAVSGLERGAMEISDRKLREFFLPPWEVGIKTQGALGVMATYPAIDNVPVHSSDYILTDILRDELEFNGLVLSEGGGITTLVYEGIAKDQQEAGIWAIQSGMDVDISFERGFMDLLYNSVQEGKVDISYIDRAVRRVLKLKYMLGLFDNPFVDPDHAEKVVHNSAHIDLALEAARAGIVLLKNDNNLLPLKKELKSIAVIGPNADHVKNQLGDYTSLNVTQEVTTVLEGVRAAVSPKTKVRYVKGCDVKGNQLNEIDQAVKVAKSSDIALLVVGENEWQTEGQMGTTGEGYDAATLELTGLQPELIKRVVDTGTPTIVILISGRALAIPEVADQVPAIIEGWFCGEKGGQAIAEVLFGDYNPSGKLPVTFPRHVGQLPVVYNSPPSKKYWTEEAWGVPYVDQSPYPLFVFGHGLSYTNFEYADLSLSSASIERDGKTKVSFTIKNTGQMAGAETAQLYLRDVQSSVTTPIKRLRGFKKVILEPGESKQIKLELGPEDLALYNRYMDKVVEPGLFEIMIGSSSADIRLKGRLTVE